MQRLQRSAWLLPLAVLAALVIFVINEAAYDRSTDALAHLGERATARTQIQRVWRSLIDAETGQRGYLLTGRPEYLQPYQQAVGEVQGALGWLSRYYRGDAEAAPLMAEMAGYSEGKLSELDTTLKLQRSGAEGAWRDLMLTDIGREKMEGLRGASSRLLALETARVARERQDVFLTLRSGRFGVSAMTALSLLALVLFLRQTLAFERVQRQHADLLQGERDRLKAEAARRTADLSELARHLQTAREDERARLARELHDELGALLTAAKLDAARLRHAIGVPSPNVQARLAHLNQSINRGIELKRRIIEDLRPSSLGHLGLVAALEILAREFAERSGLAVHTELEAVALGDSAQITLYRLVQEALTNVARHAQARSVRVSLQPRQRDGRPGACVAVCDDGRGFDPAVQRGTPHGLMGMRYRVEAEGGDLQVRAQPAAGTRIEAWLPLGAAGPVG
jgi:signal transduction histidine kinase